MTNTFQNQNVHLTNHCCFQSKTISITGRGTAVSGRIDRGVVRVNTVEIVGLEEELKAVVTGVEMFGKQLDEGIAGDNVGVLLRMNA